MSEIFFEPSLNFTSSEIILFHKFPPNILVIVFFISMFIPPKMDQAGAKTSQKKTMEFF